MPVPAGRRPGIFGFGYHRPGGPSSSSPTPVTELALVRARKAMPPGWTITETERGLVAAGPYDPEGTVTFKVRDLADAPRIARLWSGE